MTDTPHTAPKAGLKLPTAYYECESCTESGSDHNCGRPEEIRQAPDGSWLCEYCYDDAAYEGLPEDYPLWADLPKLSAALSAATEAGDTISRHAALQVVSDEILRARLAGPHHIPILHSVMEDIRALPAAQAEGQAEPVEGAPDRIWAWEGDGQDGWANAYATVALVAADQVEYIRADLAREAADGAAMSEAFAFSRGYEAGIGVGATARPIDAHQTALPSADAQQAPVSAGTDAEGLRRAKGDGMLEERRRWWAPEYPGQTEPVRVAWYRDQPETGLSGFDTEADRDAFRAGGDGPFIRRVTGNEYPQLPFAALRAQQPAPAEASASDLVKRLRECVEQYRRGLLSLDDVESDCYEAADRIAELEAEVSSLAGQLVTEYGLSAAAEMKARDFGAHIARLTTKSDHRAKSD